VSAELQELLALGIVAAVVMLYGYRRWKARGRSSPPCDGCPKGPDQSEHTLHFFKRHR